MPSNEIAVEIRCHSVFMGEHESSLCAGPGLGAHGQQHGASRLILLVAPEWSSDGSVGN